MTWTIHAMRDLNRADPLPELGPRVEPTPPPAPAPVSRGDGFLVHPDGTLSTEIEPPACPPPAPTPEPAPVAAPIPADAPPAVVLDYLMTGDESIRDAAWDAARDAARLDFAALVNDAFEDWL